MTRFLGGLAVVLLFAMMVLTFVDVVGRYFFDFPVPGGFEITEIMLASLVFAGIPLMTMTREHITVDLFDKFMPRAVEHIRTGLISLFCSVMMGTICVQLWNRGQDALEYGDTSAILLIPLAPMTFFMCVMSGVATLVFLAHAWLSLIKKQKLSDGGLDEGTMT